VRRPVHRRRWSESLGGNQLPACILKGWRKLRMEVQSGILLPSGFVRRPEVPDRRRVAGGGIPARRTLRERAQGQRGLLLLRPGAWRRELRRSDKDLSSWRLVYRPLVWCGLGWQQVADAGVHAD